jgi:hypothetical protein
MLAEMKSCKRLANIRTTSYISRQWTIIGLIAFFSGCFKGDGPDPFIPPSDIRIDAIVPQLVYTNNLPVGFDARRTLTLNGPRHLSFQWTATAYPTGSAPRIKKPGDTFTEVDGLVPGIYMFQLKVEDSAKNNAISQFPMEVKQDTLTGAPKIAGLPNRQIYKPQDSIWLSPMSEYTVNPKERKLFFSWKVMRQPQGSATVVLNNTDSYSYASRFSEGVYLFQLDIINELGLSATDYLTLTVNKDTLAGTSKIYDNPGWVRIVIYSAQVRLVISEPTIFRYRTSDNMEVSLWDDNQQKWSVLPDFMWTIQDNNLVIQIDDDVLHPFDLHTKVRISFL